jgi:hypothetical protein
LAINRPCAFASGDFFLVNSDGVSAVEPFESAPILAAPFVRAFHGWCHGRGDLLSAAPSGLV